jgi:beta-N-acetylhexosaminidase
MNVEQLLSQMTLEEKVGQMFMLAFSGNRMDEARVLMEEHLVGGSYLGNENLPSPEAAIELTNTLQSYAASTRLKIPLLLGVDQEGAWSVMTPGSAPGPGNLALGATDDPQRAYEMYGVIGRELSAVGLNTVLGPCADCNSNPVNSIIGMRSFGEKPERVAAMVAAAVRGAQDNGVAATVKHFPGHGDTRLDTHRGLATVRRSKEELWAIDLFPFVEGIKAGVGIVMTSHIIFSALDPELPATLSSTILQDVLRGQMNFDGMIVSDSMNMMAMKRNYAPEQSAVMAFRAGVDLLMLAEEHYDHDAATYLKQQRGVIQAVIRAIENGELPIEQVDESIRRILTLKSRFGFSTTPVTDKAKALGIVGSPASREVELKAARQAVAFLCNRNHLLPIPASQPTVLVKTTTRSSYDILGHTRGIGPNQTTAAYDYFADALRERRQIVQQLAAEDILSSQPEFASDAIVVAVTENYPLPGVDFDQASQPEVIKRLYEIAPERLVVVALRDPYELRYLPNAPAYLCSFSFRPCAAQAAAEALCGEATPQGRTPVSVPEVALQA